MFKRVIGERRFQVASIIGIGAQLGFILVLAILESNFSSIFCVIATVVISLWIRDVESEAGTRKKNKCYAIAMITSIFLTCMSTTIETITPALMLELIIEFAFMSAILTDAKMMPKD